jgi:rhodanese-related sulfurtransferase
MACRRECLRERTRVPRSAARWIVLLVLVTVILAGCADRISRADLMARIESGSPPPIVDVRSTSEFAASHVPGAVHVSFYSLLFHLDELPEARGDERPLVVYCEHGPRAGMARAQLWLAGVGPVLFMEGHMTAWKEDGLPVETGDPSD